MIFMIDYGLNLINQRVINEKAKTKNDGVFRFRGVTYRVLNKMAVGYAYRGEILQNFGSFNVLLANNIKPELYKKALMKI